MRSSALLLWWGLLFLVLLFAPLPLASVNTEWSMVVATICLVLGACGAVLGPLSRRERVRLPRILIPLAVFVAWIGVQLLPMPRGVLALLSPERLALPAVPGGSGSPAMTVYPGATLEQGIYILGLFYLVWALSLRPSRVPFRLLAIAGTAHALFALYLAESGGTSSTRLLWVYGLSEVLTPFGTYVNKNHFAGLMLISGGACLALFFRRLDHALRRVSELGMRARLSALTGRGFFRLLVPSVAFLIVFFALSSSGSRGAFWSLSLAGGLTLVVAVLKITRLPLWPAGIAILLLIATSMVATGGSSTSVLERFLPTGRYMNRPRLWKNTLQMAAMYPITGTGLGTYEYIFPHYQSFEPERQFTHAEGDWVQLVAETGAVGVLAMGAFVLLLSRRLARMLKEPGGRRAMVLGAAVGLLGVVLHGLVDVSLHIPANMLAAATLLGGVLAVDRGRGPRHERGGSA